MHKKEIIACAVGMLIGAFVTHQWMVASAKTVVSYDTEYHVHADFKIYIGDERVDLSADEYMTSATQELSDYVHLHDNDDEVEHIHLEGITFAEFLRTLSLELTNECLTVKNQSYCETPDSVLQLYVNNEQYADPITTYIPVDDDQILLYVGENDEALVTRLLETVTDNACYFSGTCPERGIAPPESCGLTCEL